MTHRNFFFFLLILKFTKRVVYHCLLTMHRNLEIHLPALTEFDSDLHLKLCFLFLIADRIGLFVHTVVVTDSWSMRWFPVMYKWKMDEYMMPMHWFPDVCKRKMFEYMMFVA